MANSRGKILVIRGGAIGDFILTLPVLAALRSRFPDAGLELLGYPHIAALAVAGGLVDRLQSIDARPLAGFFARNATLNEALAEYFGGFAVILSYLYDPDQIFQSNVARCSKAQFIAGPHRPSELETIHAANVFLQPLERLAIFDFDPAPRLDLGHVRDTPTISPGSAEHHRLIAVHPGSGSERKNWPEAHWVHLLGILMEEAELNFLLVGGEAEGDRLKRLAAALPPDRTRVVQNLPLPELAVQLSVCDSYIGHDSGITHLAAAVGLRGLVLWGESNEKIWRPLSEKMNLLHAVDGLKALSVDAVFEQVRSHLLAG